VTATGTKINVGLYDGSNVTAVRAWYDASRSIGCDGAVSYWRGTVHTNRLDGCNGCGSVE